MAVKKWSPIDQKAMVWWGEQNNAKLTPPFAWPQVRYTLKDGSAVIKEMVHLRMAYLKDRETKKNTP